jgi:hypothetical protein
MSADPDSLPADPRPDWDTDEGWLAGQYRIDWEKCRRMEEDGLGTVWPANFIVDPDEP